MSTASEKLRELADFIVSKEKQFDFSTFAHECGSPACGAGFACILWPDKLLLRGGLPRLKDVFPLVTGGAAVCDVIGVPRDLRFALFHASYMSPLLKCRGPKEDCTAAEYATWLRRHADAMESQ